jgi:hypothetical protein
MPLVLHRRQCGVCFPHLHFAIEHDAHALVSKVLAMIGYVTVAVSIYGGRWMTFLVGFAMFRLLGSCNRVLACLHPPLFSLSAGAIRFGIVPTSTSALFLSPGFQSHFPLYQ